METLNVLCGGLPTPTSYTQLLKSRSGLALSLFNFCRFVRPRFAKQIVCFDYSTDVLRLDFELLGNSWQIVPIATPAPYRDFELLSNSWQIMR